MQSENGLMFVPVWGEARNQLNGNEYLWSNSLKSMEVQGYISTSGAKSNGMINALLHRQIGLDAIKARTICDIVEQTGTSHLNYQNTWAKDVLDKEGWNPESCLPKEGTIIDSAISSPIIQPTSKKGEEISEEEKVAEIKALIAEINSKRVPEARIPLDSIKPFQVEFNAKQVTKVSLDGVSAKRQKDKRNNGSANEEDNKTYTYDENDGPVDYSRAPDPKKRPRVETAVAHIESEGLKYVFTGQNMFMTSLMVIAFMLFNKLLVNRNLIFFVDGGKDIKACIDKLFAFCPNNVILDWFHLRKHCNETLSMALVSGKKYRDIHYQIKRKLFHILWAGNVESAIQYVRSIEPQYIKNQSKIEDLVGYLKKNDPYIACYAIRQKLGLQISSNRVEKANDLTVASRQKGDCMSWSREGSWGLANCTAAFLNHEGEQFIEEGELTFRMYETYGKLFEPKSARLDMAA